MANHPDPLEQRLLRYRPAGPDPDLRRRVLRAAQRPRRTTGLLVYRAALAALLLLSLGLHLAAEQIHRDTAAQIGIGPVLWNADAERAAELLDAGEAGRRYIALCLRASTGRPIPS